MKTEKELNEAILKITMKIASDYPELSKFIVEMPVSNAQDADPSINLKNLEEYYDSLLTLLKKYKVTHEDNHG